MNGSDLEKNRDVSDRYFAVFNSPLAHDATSRTEELTLFHSRLQLAREYRRGHTQSTFEACAALRATEKCVVCTFYTLRPTT